jgi:hypothetical protein
LNTQIYLALKYTVNTHRINLAADAGVMHADGGAARAGQRLAKASASAEKGELSS